MNIDKLIQNLDIARIKSPTGLTYGQELVNAANLLRECIQRRINRESLSDSLSTADLADVKVEGNALTVTLNVQNSIRPSWFYNYTGKTANVFWLLNDGHKIWPENKDRPKFKAEKFVQGGVKDFNANNPLGIKVTVKRPAFYFGVE